MTQKMKKVPAMRPHSATTLRWTTSALTALCGAVFLKFTAASHTETKTDQNVIFPSVKCDKADAGDNSVETSPCQLTKELSTLSGIELQSLVAYYKGENLEIRKTESQVAGETYVWKLLFYGISRTAMKSLISQILSFVLKKERDHACYPTLGCFFPENRMGLGIGGPVTPKEAGVKFYYHTNESHSGREINLFNWENVIDPNHGRERPLTVIIHGFKESSETKQVVNLTDAVLKNVQGDVIVADWKLAAAFPYYGIAAANSALVGAEVSVLLRSMYSKLYLDPDKVHLIGFSLGAHAAGFCGRHFENYTMKKLGRITGLDPAGLLFEHTNVSLSSGDAAFVDVIHTNGGEITDLRFGMLTAVGHVDFYPNGGVSQPGCQGDHYTITCSHNKAWWLYIESVKNKTCSFTSILCKALNGYDKCFSNESSITAEMGFHSDDAKANGSYYLKTKPHSPYCIFHEKPREETKSDNNKIPSRPPR